jgi:hypothetical protein
MFLRTLPHKVHWALVALMAMFARALRMLEGALDKAQARLVGQTEPMTITWRETTPTVARGPDGLYLEGMTRPRLRPTRAVTFVRMRSTTVVRAYPRSSGRRAPIWAATVRLARPRLACAST